MDYSIAKDVNGWAYHHDWLEHAARFLANDGIVLVFAVLLVVFLAAGRRRSVAGRRGDASGGFAAVLALGVGKVLSDAVDRSRPFVEHPQIHNLVHHARDAGFPSDHATGSFAIATALLLRHRAGGTVAIALAALIAIARVAVGAHYPTDVLGGAALGALAAGVLQLPLLRRLTDRVADLVGGLYDRALATLSGGRIAPG